MAVKSAIFALMMASVLSVSFAACGTGSLTNIFSGATSIANFMFNVATDAPWLNVCFQSIGSGGGRTNLIAGNSLVVSSDVAVPAGQEALMKSTFKVPASQVNFRTGVLQMPFLALAFGIQTSSPVPGKSATAVTLSATLAQSLGTPILTPDVARIFAGKISNWNQVRVGGNAVTAARSAGYPSKAMKVVYRDESSGSTQVFTTFLASAFGYRAPYAAAGGSVFQTWPSALVSGNPIFVPQAGTGDVYKYLATTPEWAISYLQCGYATGKVVASGVQKLKSVAVRTAAGVTTTCFQCSANQALPRAPPLLNASWASINLLNQPGRTTCPITALNFLITRENYKVGPATTAQAGFKPSFKAFLNSLVNISPVEANKYALTAMPNSFKTTNLNGIKTIQI